MSTAMISAPSPASFTAFARPIPRAAPVIRATRPSRLFTGQSLLEVDILGDGIPFVDRRRERGQFVAPRLQNVAAEQQPQRWLVEGGHHENRLGHLAGVAGKVVG